MIFNERKKAGVYTAITMFLLFFLSVDMAEAQEQEKVIRWYSMKEAQHLAEKNGKKVLVYAEASWCVYCKKMEQEVFPNGAVIDSLNAYYYPVRVDIESDNAMVFNGEQISQQHFARTNKVKATPTFFFLSDSGEILGGQPGYVPADTFSRLLAFVGSDAFQKMDFKGYVKKNTKASGN